MREEIFRHVIYYHKLGVALEDYKGVKKEKRKIKKKQGPLYHNCISGCRIFRGVQRII
jgi:hypothetical protein